MYANMGTHGVFGYWIWRERSGMGRLFGLWLTESIRFSFMQASSVLQAVWNSPNQNLEAKRGQTAARRTNRWAGRGQTAHRWVFWAPSYVLKRLKPLVAEQTWNTNTHGTCRYLLGTNTYEQYQP